MLTTVCCCPLKDGGLSACWVHSSSPSQGFLQEQQELLACLIHQASFRGSILSTLSRTFLSLEGRFYTPSRGDVTHNTHDSLANELITEHSKICHLPLEILMSSSSTHTRKLYVLIGTPEVAQSQSDTPQVVCSSQGPECISVMAVQANMCLKKAQILKCWTELQVLICRNCVHLMFCQQGSVVPRTHCKWTWPTFKNVKVPTPVQKAYPR